MSSAAGSLHDNAIEATKATKLDGSAQSAAKP
jgi:hypothetical protein